MVENSCTRVVRTLLVALLCAGTALGKPTQREKQSDAKSTAARSSRDAGRTRTGAASLSSTTADDSNPTPAEPTTDEPTLVGRPVDRSLGLVTPGIRSDLFGGSISVPVEFELPAAARNARPDFKLVYDRRAEQAVAGKGWYFTVPTIRRQTVSGLSYERADFEVGYGAQYGRIVAIGDATYRAEYDSDFSRFEYRAAADEWVMTDRSGQQSTFGGTDDARLRNGQSKTAEWLLRKTKDRWGNVVIYSYSAPADEPSARYLAMMQYGGHETREIVDIPPTVEMRLYWRSSVALTPKFLFDFSTATNSVLKSISISAGGALYGAYAFSYETSSATGSPLLVSVTRFGSDSTLSADGNPAGKSLPSLNLVWRHDAAVFAAEPGVNAPAVEWGENGGRAWVDVNGDAREDYCRVVGSASQPRLVCTLGGASGFTQDVNVAFSDWGYAWSRSWADINGDGKADFCRAVGQEAMPSLRCVVSHGTSFDTGREITSGPLNVGVANTRAWVDVNGDGLLDFCRVISENGIRLRCQLKGEDGFGREMTSDPIDAGEDGGRSWSDVNGDGLADFCRVKGQKVMCTLGDREQFGKAIEATVVDPGEPEFRWWADINSDGKADYCRKIGSPQGAVLKCALSTGSGFAPSDISSAPIDFGEVWGRGWRDVNGDGAADFCRLVAAADGKHLHCLISGGRAFGTDIASGIVDGGYEDGRAWTDANGDGLADYCRVVGNPGSGAARCTPITSGADLLTEERNGYGGVVAVEYSPSSMFPNTRLPFVLPLVSSLTTSTGPLTARTTFEYEGGFYSAKQREFRGFAHVRSRGPAKQGRYRVNDIWFHQGDELAPDDVPRPFADKALTAGREYRSRTSDESGHLLTSREVRYRAASGPSFFNPPASVSESLCDQQAHCSTVITESVFDGFGNEIRTFERAGEGLDRADRVIERRFLVPTDRWLLSLPISEALYDSTLRMVSHRSYLYDENADALAQVADVGNVTAVEDDRGVNSRLTRFRYDRSGNVTRSCDALEHCSDFVYDRTGARLIAATDAVGHKTEFAYVAVAGSPQQGGRYGDLISKHLPTGAAFQYEHDEFGRVMRYTSPTSTASRWTYNDIGGPNQNVQIASSDGRFERTTFDGFGRPTAFAWNGPNGRLITQERAYDEQGNIGAETEPHYTDESAIITSRAYDVLGRVVRVTHPDGSYRTRCYFSRGFGTVDENRHLQVITTNIRALPVRVDIFDNTGTDECTAAGPRLTIAYGYRADDRLIEIIDPLQNVIRIHRDGVGDVMSVDDPDIGITTFERDAVGNVTRRADARERSVYYTYDAANRLRQKDYDRAKKLGRGDFEFRYDRDRLSTGLLSSIQSRSGAESYDYDIMGRVAATTYDIKRSLAPAAHFRIGSDFDARGRLHRLVYPSGHIATYEYDGPFLKRVLVDSRLLAQFDNVSANGKPAHISFANGVSAERTYSRGGVDDCSVRPGFICAESIVAPRTVVASNTYRYDGIGNLIERNDALTDESIRYAYDARDRLLSVATSSDVLERYKYDDSDNVLETFTAKQEHVFTYPGAGPASHRPHAIDSFDGQPWRYDQTGRLVSNGRQFFRYDAEGHLTFSRRGPWIMQWLPGRRTSYQYNARGERISKTSTAVTEIFGSMLYDCTWHSCRDYIRAYDDNIAMYTAAGSAGSLTFIHTDLQHSTRALSAETGELLGRIDHTSYGGRTSTASRQLADLHDRFLFARGERDGETGLDYMGARYYDSSVGRFITPDETLQVPATSGSLNRYAYVSNNPLRFDDPDGRMQEDAQGPSKLSYERGAKRVINGIAVSLETDGVGAVVGIPDAVRGGTEILMKMAEDVTGQRIPEDAVAVMEFEAFEHAVRAAAKMGGLDDAETEQLVKEANTVKSLAELTEAFEKFNITPTNVNAARAEAAAAEAYENLRDETQRITHSHEGGDHDHHDWNDAPESKREEVSHIASVSPNEVESTDNPHVSAKKGATSDTKAHTAAETVDKNGCQN